MYFSSLYFGIGIGAMALGRIAEHVAYAGMYRMPVLYMVAFLVIYILSVARGFLQQKQRLVV